MVVIVAAHDGIQVVKVVEVLLEAGPVQVGAGRGDVGIVFGQEVGVGVGRIIAVALVVGMLRVLGGRNLPKVKGFWLWGGGWSFDWTEVRGT